MMHITRIGRVSHSVQSIMGIRIKSKRIDHELHVLHIPTNLRCPSPQLQLHHSMTAIQGESWWIKVLDTLDVFFFSE